MSLLSWLFRKPAASPPAMPRPQGAAQGESQAFLPPDATVPLGGGRPIPPAASRAANRKNERIERRALLYSVVRDAMVRASVLSASYKFKVLSLDQQGRQFLVMIDLAHEFGSDMARLCEREAVIAQMAKARYDILVTAVYWRTHEHVAVGQLPKNAPAPSAAPASPPESAAPPVSPLRPPRRCSARNQRRGRCWAHAQARALIPLRPTKWPPSSGRCRRLARLARHLRPL